MAGVKFLYAARSTTADVVKVGASRNLTTRLAALSRKHKMRFVLERATPARLGDEGTVHRLLSSFRADMPGREFFVASRALPSIHAAFDRQAEKEAAPERTVPRPPLHPLEKWRLGKGLTYVEMAAKFGCRPSTAHRWCTGQSVPRAGEIAKLIRRTGLAVEDLQPASRRAA